MDDRDKFLAYMTILASIVGLLVLLIDFKIKNDLIQQAIKIDNDLRLISAFTGTMGPHEKATENGSDPVPNWAGLLRRDNVAGDDAVVETRGRFAQPDSETAEEAESTVPETRDGNSGIPAED